jgi:predicted Rossmann fold flavoprotein
VETWDVIVVGGGAAGLMAAGEAAGAGARVLLLEKMRRPGRKLRITGKGRCNVTNVAAVDDFLDHFGPTGLSLRQAFARYFSDDVMAFFESQGVPLVTERGGRVFPASGKATDVVDALVRWVSRQGVETRAGRSVDRLVLDGDTVCGVDVGGTIMNARTTILAVGGASYPATGSTGDGYRMAAAVGHTIVEPRAALVPLETRETIARELPDLTLRNVRVQVLVDGTLAGEHFGELTFMSYGVSGPVILTASGGVVDALSKGKKVELSIDLKPALSEQKLENRLLRDFASRGTEPMQSILRGLLPKPLVRPCLVAVGIPAHRTGSAMKTNERQRLLAWLKDFRLTVSRPRPLSEAIITAGGVDMKEIDPRTMASRLVKGLYIAGELLDLHGDTGGYNLQAAFSTGWLAGRSAAEMVVELGN